MGLCIGWVTQVSACDAGRWYYFNIYLFVTYIVDLELELCRWLVVGGGIVMPAPPGLQIPIPHVPNDVGPSGRRVRGRHALLVNIPFENNL